jgi:hypothetical protein
MFCFTFVHNVLNVLLQVANKMGLQKKVFYISDRFFKGLILTHVPIDEPCFTFTAMLLSRSNSLLVIVSNVILLFVFLGLDLL